MKRWKYWVSLLLTAGFVLGAWLVLEGRLAGFEAAAYGFLASLRRTWLNAAMESVTRLGDGATIQLVVLILLLLPRTRLEAGVPIALSTGISGVLNRMLKEMFARPRPQVPWLVEAGGYSFPSGHSMTSMALYLLLAQVLWESGGGRRWPRGLAALCAVLPFAIGVSRVYLGVHYAGDVLCGWMAGAVIALLTGAARRWIAESAHCVGIRRMK